jgi:CelD/BcsL family acetyltransferase involved in cellulose biosynthesis
MSVRVEVGDIGDLVRHAAAWDGLLATQPLPDPLRRARWLTAWWDAFGAARRARVVLVWEGDALVAGAALMVDRFPGGLRVLRHLGTSPHWFDPDPPVRPDAAGARAALVAAVLAIPDVDLVALEDLPRGGATARALLAASGAARELPQGERRNRYRADAPPPLEARRRSNRNRLEARRRAGRPLEMAVADDPVRAAAMLDEAFDLTRRAWSGRGDSSEVTHPAGRRYVREAIRDLRPGDLALGTVRAGGRLVAFDLALRNGPSAVMFRGNWDPASGISGAGWLSMVMVIDHLVEGGVAVVDLGKFDWAYKRELSSAPRAELATAALARGLRGRAALRIWTGRPALIELRRWTRRWVRRGRRA